MEILHCKHWIYSYITMHTSRKICITEILHNIQSKTLQVVNIKKYCAVFTGQTLKNITLYQLCATIHTCLTNSISSVALLRPIISSNSARFTIFSP